MSSFEEIKAELLASGDKFVDEDFPASKSSLCLLEEEGQNWDSIQWKRPHVSAVNVLFGCGHLLSVYYIIMDA